MNIIECTYTNLDGIAYYIHLGYMVLPIAPKLQYSMLLYKQEIKSCTRENDATERL